jgi:excisionase family DNA binding protein
MTTTNAFKPLTKDDVADVLGVSLRTIENWVNERTLPAPKKLGNRVYWHPAVFYAWLEHQLTVEETLPTNFQPPMEKPQKAARKSQVKSSKSEVDMLRSRDQAKIDALLA